MSNAPKGFHDAEVYLQVEATFGSEYDTDRREYVDIVRGIKVVGFTQKRPGRPKRGTLTAKLTLRMPDGAFLPLRPDIVVTVPENMTIQTPIEITVGDANEEDQQ